MSLYIRPTALDEALDALAAHRLTIVAGGTDFYPARVGRVIGDDVLDITGIDQLRGVSDAGDYYRIGALATWSELIETPLPAHFDGLKLAAREIGGVQIQNVGTVCGNLCNASPAADGLPCLLTLDAMVEIAGPGGVRTVPAGAFVTGNRATVLGDGELVTALLVAKPQRSAASGFVKLGSRKYLIISIVMAAAVIEIDEGGSVAAARVAVGACSVVARRLAALEAALVGRPCDATLGDAVTPDHIAPLSPIDDIRGSAEYRADAALTVVRRLLGGIGGAS